MNDTPTIPAAPEHGNPAAPVPSGWPRRIGASANRPADPSGDLALRGRCCSGPFDGQSSRYGIASSDAGMPRRIGDRSRPGRSGPEDWEPIVRRCRWNSPVSQLSVRQAESDHDAQRCAGTRQQDVGGRRFPSTKSRSSGAIGRRGRQGGLSRSPLRRPSANHGADHRGGPLVNGRSWSIAGWRAASIVCLSILIQVQVRAEVAGPTDPMVQQFASVHHALPDLAFHPRPKAAIAARNARSWLPMIGDSRGLPHPGGRLRLRERSARCHFGNRC